MKIADVSITNEFYNIVVENIPLIDVRAPVEFSAGAFPMAVNLPIMDDLDRHLVGICYKKKGKDAAFELAHHRVSGQVKEERIAAWCDFVDKHPNALFYCFRGGMRSKTAQRWFEEKNGSKVARLAGGYKAFRRYLIDSLNPENISAVPVILGGRTGTGKTILLRKLANAIDLEEIAHHRGSAFGSFLTPQPSQIDFENNLACAIIRHGHEGFKYMILEDEGNYIGARYIPKELAAYWKRDSMVLLECDLAFRIETTFQEYVGDAQKQFLDFYGEEEYLKLWREDIEARVQRIRKRLGGERLKKVLGLIDAAHKEQLRCGDSRGHSNWIEVLLSEYYDPMYDYQIEKSKRTIVFRGNFSEVHTYFEDLEEKRQ